MEHSNATPLRATYRGDQTQEINEFQTTWESYLRPLLSTDYTWRLDDILLCCREGTLNAMQHGCEGRPDRVCQLHLLYDTQHHSVLIRIEDPGQGHNCLPTRPEEILTGKSKLHLGLAIMSRLSDRFEMQQHGTCVVLEFNLHSQKE